MLGDIDAKLHWAHAREPALRDRVATLGTLAKNLHMIYLTSERHEDF